MFYASFFSILFFSVCIISLVIGILIIKNNPRAPSSCCFFALIIAINFWSAGLGFANIAPDAVTCEIWRRFSAIGWGTVYGIILHFILIITGKENLLKKWWFYFFLYLPAAITIFAFAIPTSVNPDPYSLLHTEFGWINVAKIADYNLWDWVFWVYYMSYVITGIILVLLWGIKSTDHKAKMESRAIFLSFSVTFLIAATSDMLLGNILSVIPQMAPIVILIPIITIYSLIKKYNFIVSEPIGKGSNYIRIIISIILYLILAYLQIGLSTRSHAIENENFQRATLNGIITQIQMLISLYLVLKENRSGYIAAILVNAGSILTSINFAVRTRSTEPLPGTVSYIGVVLIIVLIANYKKKTHENMEEIDTQRKMLYTMAYNDSLTGLHNKEWFIEDLSRSIHFAKRNASFLAVVFIDLDSFKTVNDTMGHSTGDAVLKMMANRLSSSLREEDAISRFGGDEFLINLSCVKKIEDLKRITERIMGVFKNSITVQDIEYFVSASVGVAVYPIDGEDAETLIKNADIAMYLAKSRGKNQCVFCTSDIKNDTIKKMKLTNYLYKALNKEELYLVYQPQIDAKTQEICGFEALLRWNNEEYGNVTPDVFIPMAEQTGLIRPIGLWVFETACNQFKKIQKYYNKEFSMSINLSIEQLKDIGISGKLKKVLDDMEVDATKIQIEITESIAFNDDPTILQRIKEIKELGILISIDDFGTGFSSFTRLKTFPIDVIKIDMNFVHGISSGSQKDIAIINSMIQIAQNLGIDVLAEGVESEAQFAYLKANGCHKIQGYYFYKPMLANDVEALLEENAEDHFA